jgi:hypothetical protein
MKTSVVVCWEWMIVSSSLVAAMFCGVDCSYWQNMVIWSFGTVIASSMISGFSFFNRYGKEV